MARAYGPALQRRGQHARAQRPRLGPHRRRPAGLLRAGWREAVKVALGKAWASQANGACRAERPVAYSINRCWAAHH